MAKLKAVLQSLEDVPEGMRDLYTAGEDGRFYLDADGVDDLPSVQGLKSAFEKTKREAKQLKDAAQKYEGLDPEKYREMMEAAAKKEEQSALDKGEYERLIKARDEHHAKEIAKRDAEVAKREKFIHRLLVENELSAAIEKAGIKPEYRDGVLAMMEKRGPVVIAEGDEYRGIFKTDIGDEKPISEYVAEWAKSDAAAHYLPPSGKYGSGAESTSGGGAPRGAATFNRNDPLAWGANAEKVVKGEARAQ